MKITINVPELSLAKYKQPHMDNQNFIAKLLFRV